MGGIYKLIPKSSHAVVKVATGTSIRTTLQVGVPSTTDIRVLAWSIGGDATSGVPGICTLVDVAATVTSQTPEKWQSADLQAALCVAGTTASGHTGTAEGTITDSRVLDSQLVSPAGGYAIWFPSRPRVKASRFLRIRCTFAVDVNVIPWIIFEEGA